jgi:hypothetical protein
MFPRAPRYLLVIVLLFLAAAITWGQRRLAALGDASTSQVVGAKEPASATGQEPDSPAVEYTYFVDVEGWYRITPYETAVRSAYDLSGGTTEALALAIPPVLGAWRQASDDQFIGDDPAIVYYLNHPTVALQRTYQDATGQSLTLTIVGNRGEDSFLLFSHTPETCYPGRLWQVVASRRESTLLGERPLYVQYLLTEHSQTGQQLMVLYWYLWDSPQRDPQAGVLSMRVNLFLADGQSQEAVMARAWDFVRQLFPEAAPWERF